METANRLPILEVNAILHSYNIGQVLKMTKISVGFANQNYKLETNKGLYLYRVCKEQSVTMIHYELNLMDTLKFNNFLTAYPIPKANGEFITKTNLGYVVIYEFIEGNEPALNEKTVAEIAMHVAKLNSISNWEKHERQNAINLDDCLKMAYSFKKYEYQYPKIFNDFENLLQDIKESLSVKIPKGLIHADVFPDNTLFQGDKLLAIIDFEEACTDNLLFDVGMTINGFCFKHNQFNKNLFESFINAYTKVRTLNGAEKNKVHDYIIWGAVGMAYWHLRHLVKRPYQKQEDRVRELLDRALRFKHNHSRKEIQNIIK